MELLRLQVLTCRSYAAAHRWVEAGHQLRDTDRIPDLGELSVSITEAITDLDVRHGSEEKEIDNHGLP
jgi:hypothetical protein